MKFSAQELKELSSIDGGRFQISKLEEAFFFTKTLASSHYENFPVASLFLPKLQRQHIFNIYAFARIADDIADEPLPLDKTERLRMLNGLETLFETNNNKNPIFSALHQTIIKLGLPLLPFKKLLEAFKLDVSFCKPSNMQDLFYYCERSANPIGELVLRVFGLYNDKTAPLSDKICTALQLANFWQDFSRDIPNSRMYIPTEILNKYDLNYETIIDENNKNKINEMLEELYDTTSKLFLEGKALINYLKPIMLKLEIELTIAGGRAVLSKTRNLKENIFVKRPKLRKSEILGFFIKNLFFH